jgi:hypothetical protein
VVWAEEGHSAAVAARSGRASRRDLLRSGRIALGRVGRRMAADSGVVGGRRGLLRRLRGSGAASGLGVAAHTWVRCGELARCIWVLDEECVRRRWVCGAERARRSWHVRSGRSAESYGEGLLGGLVRRSELEMAL